MINDNNKSKIDKMQINKIFIIIGVLLLVYGLDATKCPNKVDKNGTYLVGDKLMCNTYHECDCTSKNFTCTLLRSSVCPRGKVFSNKTQKCEAIETYGCDGLYLQWANDEQKMNRSWLLENDETIPQHQQQQHQQQQLLQKPQVTDINYFMCPQGSNSRYADPFICNIFHVCVTRGDQTYDQPFLCPYGSIFRIIDSQTMYCDRKQDKDCQGQSFYKASEDDVKLIKFSSIRDEVKTTFKCGPNNGLFEDPLYCNTYHRCLNGQSDEHLICENQLLFNSLSNLCDYPINVKCPSHKTIFKKSAIVVQEAKTSSLPIKETKNATSVFTIINGVKILLNCPSNIQNALIPDAKYCNVFHHCHSGSGTIFSCEKGQAFDGAANGPEKSGVCNFEDMVDCEGKFILLENGQRLGQPAKSKQQQQQQQQQQQSANYHETPKKFKYYEQPQPQQKDELSSSTSASLTSIPFDCITKTNGHFQDTRFCDVFHACVNGEQKKTYTCAQLGERVYFDESSKRCEFVRNNPRGCPQDLYFTQITIPNAQQGIVNQQQEQQQVEDQSSLEPWKIFIKSKEQFTCSGKSDGFYASRWCNVFYRCFIGIKTEFLCPKMMNTDRLWWIQHGSSQEIPQNSAACVWPCESKRECQSPGGVVIEQNGQFSESQQEAKRIYQSSQNCVDDSAANDVFRIQDSQPSCDGVPEGNFIEGKFCNVFHRCTNGKRKDFQCAKATNTPYDLWWNPAKNQCDWPCKVQCSKSIYNSQKSASQIQIEDKNYNEYECRDFNPNNNTPFVQTTRQPLFTTTATSVQIPLRPIPQPYPDNPYVCLGVGLFLSPKFCNVYYDCRAVGQPPVASFYCDGGFFDNVSKTCKPRNQVSCPYMPALEYPNVPIAEPNAPEDIGCSSLGYYIIHSNRYCNLYYVCDGTSSQPQTFRCYDRQNLEDAVYNKETKRCESRTGSSCQGEILSVKIRYQSSPVDLSRLSDLQQLSCRADQQYLAEHDRYCNLYHSCILGKYQMYACVTIGGLERNSYFYYTNGDCDAPNAAQCGPNKSVYAYEKLFPLELYALGYPTAREQTFNYYSPEIAPSMAYTGQANFDSMQLRSNNNFEPIMECEYGTSYYIPHQKFCNLFYECSNGKLKLNICIDQQTGVYAGIFDRVGGKCKPFNTIDCPTNALYNPAKIDTPSLSHVFTTDSKFSCVARPNGYYESEWCNVFYRCLNGKRIDTRCSLGDSYDLWWEHQNANYSDSNPRVFFGSDEDAKCEWPCKVKCSKPVWSSNLNADTIQRIDSETHPGCTPPSSVIASAPKHAPLVYHGAPMESTYKAYETENSNPSGFFCESDGTYRDPLFCNIYHVCIGKSRKTFHCRQYDTDGTGRGASIYDTLKQSCVPRDEGIHTCSGLIYDPNFMILPAYRELPLQRPTCDQAGVFKAQDAEFAYCDLFYWCEKKNSEAIYFHCNSAVYGKGFAFFNSEFKQCDQSTNVNCPYPNRLYSNVINRQQSDVKHVVLQQQQQPSPYLMQIVDMMQMDPAPGYITLPSTQFQTSFTCTHNSPGYYPNPEFCDVFHYCYTNGQFKTYVCASMQNRYQLWWSHQSELGRRDNIYCDWPCNLVGPNTICPANKRVLMRDRQQIQGGISQTEVLESTCPNINPIMNHPQTHPTTQTTTSTTTSTSTLMHATAQPCVRTNNFNEWFMSSPTIRCTHEQRLHGFASDSKDCSKYYRCDQNIGFDQMSTGYLMSCVAGLWWDQSRRMCVAPSETNCNPYEIINNMGVELAQQNPYPSYLSSNTNDNPSQPSCKLMSCAQAGLTRDYMKSIPGKTGYFYKCDGACAIEMQCPMDLIFDDSTQQCEYIYAPSASSNDQQVQRMASLRMAKSIKSKNKNKQKKCDCENENETIGLPTTSAATTTKSQ